MSSSRSTSEICTPKRLQDWTLYNIMKSNRK